MRPAATKMKMIMHPVNKKHGQSSSNNSCNILMGGEFHNRFAYRCYCYEIVEEAYSGLFSQRMNEVFNF